MNLYLCEFCSCCPNFPSDNIKNQSICKDCNRIYCKDCCNKDSHYNLIKIGDHLTKNAGYEKDQLNKNLSNFQGKIDAIKMIMENKDKPISKELMDIYTKILKNYDTFEMKSIIEMSNFILKNNLDEKALINTMKINHILKNHLTYLDVVFKLKKFTQSIENLDELDKRNNDLNKENLEIENNIKISKKILEGLQQSEKNEQDKIHRLEEIKKQFIEDLNKIENDIKIKEGTLINIETNIEDLVHKINEHQNTLKSIKIEIEEDNRHKDQGKRELDEIMHNINEKDQRYNEIDNNVELAQDSLETLNIEYKKLRTKLDKGYKELKIVKNEIEKFEEIDRIDRKYSVQVNSRKLLVITNSYEGKDFE